MSRIFRRVPKLGAVPITLLIAVVAIGISIPTFALGQQAGGGAQIAKKRARTHADEAQDVALINRQAAKLRGPKGDKGDPGTNGINGINGTKGTQGAPGPTASSFASFTDVSSPLLTSAFVKVIDLTTGTNGGLISTTFAGRILAHTSVDVFNNEAAAREAKCKLQIAPSGGAFADMSQTMTTRVQPVAGSQNVEIPVVGAANEPPGTYNVQAVCETGGSDMHFSAADLIAWGVGA